MIIAMRGLFLLFPVSENCNYKIWGARGGIFFLRGGEVELNLYIERVIKRSVHLAKEKFREYSYHVTKNKT